MEPQLQIYLTMAFGGGLLATLIFTNIILAIYVVKLYEKFKNYSARRESIQPEVVLRASEPQSANAYNNTTVNMDDELSRRFTQYTPDQTMEREKHPKSNKGLVESEQNISYVQDVTVDEFSWRQNDRSSQYNSNIVLQNDRSLSPNEARTYFNDRDFN